MSKAVDLSDPKKSNWKSHGELFVDRARALIWAPTYTTEISFGWLSHFSIRSCSVYDDDQCLAWVILARTKCIFLFCVSFHSSFVIRYESQIIEIIYVNIMRAHLIHSPNVFLWLALLLLSNKIRSKQNGYIRRVHDDNDDDDDGHSQWKMLEKKKKCVVANGLRQNGGMCHRQRTPYTMRKKKQSSRRTSLFHNESVDVRCL